MLIAFIMEAKRHGIWHQIKLLMELLALVVGLVAAAVIFAVIGWPEWYSVAILLLASAVCATAIVVWLARYTYITWQRSIREYQQSDESPYSPTYYQQDNVA